MEDDGNELVTLLGPFWSAAKVVDALGLEGEQALDDRIGADLLVLTTSDGERRFPTFQFRAGRDGSAEVHPDLAPLLRALRQHDPWAVGTLLRTPADELGGRTPLEWVRDGGDAEALRMFAQRVDDEWSR